MITFNYMSSQFGVVWRVFSAAYKSTQRFSETLCGKNNIHSLAWISFNAANNSLWYVLFGNAI